MTDNRRSPPSVLALAVRYVAGKASLCRCEKESLSVRVTYSDGRPQENETYVENGTFTIVGSQAIFSVPASGGSAGYSWTGAVAGGVTTYTYDGVSYRFVR